MEWKQGMANKDENLQQSLEFRHEKASGHRLPAQKRCAIRKAHRVAVAPESTTQVDDREEALTVMGVRDG